MVLTQKAVGGAAIIVGLGVLRIKAKGFVVILDGFGRLPNLKVGGAPVLVGSGKLRVEADGFGIVLNSNFGPAQASDGITPVKVGLGILRVEGCLFVGKLADNVCIKHFDNYRRRKGDQ